MGCRQQDHPKTARSALEEVVLGGTFGITSNSVNVPMICTVLRDTAAADLLRPSCGNVIQPLDFEAFDFLRRQHFFTELFGQSG